MEKLIKKHGFYFTILKWENNTTNTVCVCALEFRKYTNSAFIVGRSWNGIALLPVSNSILCVEGGVSFFLTYFLQKQQKNLCFPYFLKKYRLFICCYNEKKREEKKKKKTNSNIL